MKTLINKLSKKFPEAKINVSGRWAYVVVAHPQNPDFTKKISIRENMDGAFGSSCAFIVGEIFISEDEKASTVDEALSIIGGIVMKIEERFEKYKSSGDEMIGGLQTLLDHCIENKSLAADFARM